MMGKTNTTVVLEFQRGLLAPHEMAAVSNRAFAKKVNLPFYHYDSIINQKILSCIKGVTKKTVVLKFPRFQQFG